MSALIGFDEHSGGQRRVGVQVMGPHVLLAVEGSDGTGAAMLTPEQCRALAKMLTDTAESTAVGYAEWPVP